MAENIEKIESAISNHREGRRRCKVIYKDHGFTDVEKTNSIQILKWYGIVALNSKDTSIEDISEEAISLYRKLRERINPLAEELSYNNEELMKALGCIKKEKGTWYITYTGILVFGKKIALRRLLPMVRVDYIRVPGNQWVQDPESRFVTVVMRGPLIELVQRTFNS